MTINNRLPEAPVSNLQVARPRITNPLETTMKKYLVLLVLTLQVAHAQPTGRIVDTATGQTVSPEQLAHILAQAQIVLIGEQHDKAEHHQAQQWLLQATEQARANGSVALEMLTPEQQPAINDMQAYLLNGGSTGRRSLEDKINWNAAWDWSQYQNLMYTLLHQKAPILAANPSRSQLRQQTDFQAKGEHSGHPAVHAALSQLMHNHHSNTQNLVAMQQYKDFTMSRVLLAAPKPAWLIAGNIHVSKQLGVPLFLRDAGFADNLKVVLMSEEGSNADRQHADYIWFF